MTLPLILASSSPFRAMLMENAGLRFAAVPAVIDERAIETPLALQGAAPDAIAMILAEVKALDVSARFPDAFVIGSDQTMSLGDVVFHKPKDIDEAANHLRTLSGKTHRLNSAVAIARGGNILWTHIAHAELTMRNLSPDFIRRHIKEVGERALASVGAYQLEGQGIQLFSRIEGDYFTILGLPMLSLLAQLRELGLVDA
jgi:septum formation protein